MNVMKALGLKKNFEQLMMNHPKFPAFCRAAFPDKFQEGSVIEIKITSPDGSQMITNVKLTADDIASIREIKEAL